MPSAASMSDSASAAPRPREQPTDSEVTSGVTSQNSISPAMTRRCAASSPGSAASHARPVVAPVSLLPVLLPPNPAPAESGPAAADMPHHPSASMSGDACPVHNGQR
jgi:hypothetical protein